MCLPPVDLPRGFQAVKLEHAAIYLLEDLIALVMAGPNGPIDPAVYRTATILASLPERVAIVLWQPGTTPPEAAP